MSAPPSALALADIDGDGDVDLFKSAGPSQQAQLLLNAGNGSFHLEPESPDEATGAAFLDLQNDGDLDLVTAQPTLLYNNRGDGLLTPYDEAPAMRGETVVVLDFDLDGSQDVLFGDRYSGLHTYHNRDGQDQHHLRVVPVGDRGTRGGIGTRVEVKTANDQHWRQIMAAASDRQGESVAHFGLGSDSAELLVVTWPSSQVDTIRRPQLDETIYVYEGRTIYTYFATLPSSLHLSTPDTLIAGQTTELELLVRPSLEETKSGIEHVVADLSALGGDGGLPLTAVGVGNFSASLSASRHWSDTLGSN